MIKGSQQLYLVRVRFLHASSNFCSLLITFANCMDPDQDQQNVDPDLDPYCLIPERIFGEKHENLGQFNIHFLKQMLN